nr:hypothetical protein [Nanoarchaeum sp.]
MVFTYELKIVPKNEFYPISGYRAYPLGCSTPEGTFIDYVVMEKRFGKPNSEQQSLLNIIKIASITKENPTCDISITFK